MVLEISFRDLHHGSLSALVSIEIWLLEFMEITSTFVLDRTFASLHALITRPVFPLARDIPVSVRIPAFKEEHAVKVHFLCKVWNQKIPINRNRIFGDFRTSCELRTPQILGPRTRPIWFKIQNGRQETQKVLAIKVRLSFYHLLLPRNTPLVFFFSWYTHPFLGCYIFHEIWCHL